MISERMFDEWFPYSFADKHHHESPEHLPQHSDEFVKILQTVLSGSSDWEWQRSGLWVYVHPKGYSLPDQGWKLHVSATPASAPVLLERLLPVLLGSANAFKFAASPYVIRLLNHPYWPRAGSGKFITIYPRDDSQFRCLAEECHALTCGLEGPDVLSDRRYKPDGLVFYRYGAFKRNLLLYADGFVRPVIYDQDGKAIFDIRRPWFTIPSWVKDPMNPAALEAPPRNLLLDGRYRVVKALRHNNRGGTYTAFDEEAGREVILKEARPHVATDLHARDAVDRLKREFSILSRLHDLPIVPRVYDLFEAGGHWFLVEDVIPGKTLRTLVGEIFAASPKGFSLDEQFSLFGQLASLLEAVHSRGIVLRDFTPNNIMVLPDGKLRTFDLELAYDKVEGAPAIPGGTPGYMSPQHEAGQHPCEEDDLFCLGALFFFCATGRDPLALPDWPAKRTCPERLEERLKLFAADVGLPDQLVALILNLLEDDPAKRPNLSEVAKRSDDLRQSANAASFQSISRGLLTDDDRQITQCLHGIVHYLLEKADFSRQDRLWPTHWWGLAADPTCLQFGASGVGLFLIEAANATARSELTTLMRRTIDWCEARLGERLNRLPGMYFGLSGVSWFFLDAARFLRDEGLSSKAKAIALSIPLESSMPDLVLGTAGIGMTSIHFWIMMAETIFLERALRVGEQLVAGARDGEQGLLWPIPENPPIEGFSGLPFYGFGHGNAGIATFFLYLYLATGDEWWLRKAYIAAETLFNVVEVDDDCAFWAFGPGDTRYWAHWCNGSSGVGTALVRFYRITNEHKYLLLAKKAANAVMRDKWKSSLVQCHGLAGNGQFLLDLFEATGEERYREMARELAQIIIAHRVYYDSDWVFPGEGMMRLQADYGTGMAGVGGFLLRYLRGGRRPLMADTLMDRF